MSRNGLSMDLTLDWDTADRITVATLSDYQDTLEKQLEQYHNGSWLHADDVVHSQKMIEALKFVLRDFGVSDE